MVLGITILVAFSLAATAFALYEPKRFAQLELPPNLGQWQPLAEPSRADRQMVEQRIILLEGGWLRRPRLVRQVRVRDRYTREIVEVGPELPVKGQPWL